jgi:hypothetical protein
MTASPDGADEPAAEPAAEPAHAGAGEHEHENETVESADPGTAAPSVADA